VLKTSPAFARRLTLCVGGATQIPVSATGGNAPSRLPADDSEDLIHCTQLGRVSLQGVSDGEYRSRSEGWLLSNRMLRFRLVAIEDKTGPK